MEFFFLADETALYFQTLKAFFICTKLRIGVMSNISFVALILSTLLSERKKLFSNEGHTNCKCLKEVLLKSLVRLDLNVCQIAVIRILA